MGTRLIYVDDSGSREHDLTVYAFLEVAAGSWSQALGGWLALRKDWSGRHQIPVGYELHAHKFLQGRGNPSLDPGWNRQKAARRGLGEQALGVIADTPGVALGVFYRPEVDRAGTYRAAVAALQNRLHQGDAHAVVAVDGDGTERHYWQAHRALPLAGRRVLEDPWYQPASGNQWIQVADLVAYTAYQHLVRQPGAGFMWDWYDRYLRRLDWAGGPRQV